MLFKTTLLLTGLAAASQALEFGAAFHQPNGADALMSRSTQCKEVAEPNCESSCGEGYKNCVHPNMCFNPINGESCCENGSESCHPLFLFLLDVRGFICPSLKIMTWRTDNLVSCSLLPSWNLLRRGRLLPQQYESRGVQDRANPYPDIPNSKQHRTDDCAHDHSQQHVNHHPNHYNVG